ncbi:MAG: M56 family metallopeptidase [Saprospiraceae bacterium]|nr:M56 family metallopeptidase [Saprospiraceae bacterium]
MNAELFYAIEFTISLGLFYLLYYFVLRKETFFRWNRFYIILAVLISLLVPFIKDYFIQKQLISPMAFIEEKVTLSYILPFTVEIVADHSTVNWLLLVKLFILLVSLFFAVKFTYGLLKIFRMINVGEKIISSKNTFVFSDSIQTAYSFLQFIFLPKNFNLENPENQTIIRHEMTHVNQLHSADVILFQIFHILFWWNPFIHLFYRELRLVHEYLADEEVLQVYPSKNYMQMLFDSVNPEKLSMAHSFSTSQLKHRIIMMTKTKSSRNSYFKYAYFLPLLIVLFQYCVKAPTRDLMTEFESYTSTDTITVYDPETYKEWVKIVKRTIYKNAAVMPQFNQCGPDVKSDDCVLKYLADHIKYPESARKANIEGTVITKIYINQNGEVESGITIKSLTQDCDFEVTSVLRNMPKWSPGLIDGKPVTVEYTVPVKFKLSN